MRERQALSVAGTTPTSHKSSNTSRVKRIRGTREVKKAVCTPVRVASDWRSSLEVELLVLVGLEVELVVELVGRVGFVAGPVGSSCGLKVVEVFGSVLAGLEESAAQVMRLKRNPAASRNRIFHFLVIVQGIRFQILVRVLGLAVSMAPPGVGGTTCRYSTDLASFPFISSVDARRALHLQLVRFWG